MSQEQFKSRRRRSSQPVRRSPGLSDSRYQGFVRSRTLTGSKSSQVSSASEKRGFLVSSRLKAQNLKKHRTLLVSAVVASWLVVVGLVYLLDQYIAQPSFKSDEIAMERSLSAALQENTQEYLSNRPLERFRFAIDRSQYLAYLTNKIPELNSIDLENEKGLANTSIKVGLRQPVAKWQLDGTTYYVDAAGQAFEKNYFREPSVRVRDNSGLPPSQQRRLASRQLLTFIGQIVDGVNKSPNTGNVKEVVIPPASLKSIDIILAGQDYRIKLNTDREVAAQVSDLRSAVRYIKENNLSPNYIDVRVEGRAYYR